MEVRNNVDGLQTLLGIGGTKAPAGSASAGQSSKTETPLAGDVATLSSVGAQMQQAGTESDVRMETVTRVQAALAAGAYQVSSAAVAGKVIDSMIQGGVKSGS
jgi:flagellar biosynthesis anti-sigma factor FlgM